MLSHRPDPGAGHRALAQSAAVAQAFLICWRGISRPELCAPRCTRSSIILRIYRRPFTCRPSRRRSSFRSTVSAIFPARPGEWEGCRSFDRWPSLFSALARHLLSGAHAVSRVSALWRRVQGDGACSLRQAHIPRCYAQDRASHAGWIASSSISHYFRHHRAQISYQWSDGAPEFGDLFSPALEELLGPRRKPDDPLEDRHRDIARSVQAMYEEAFFHLIETLQERYGLTNLALAGGCAMNSVANGKVRRITPFRRVYVQSAAGDAGGAIGAAFALWHKLGGERSFVMDHAYWGPQFRRG